MSQFSISGIGSAQPAAQALTLQPGDVAAIGRVLAGAIQSAPLGGTPLSALVQQTSGALAEALGVAGDPVASGRLGAATTDFAREVKALVVGGLDRTPAALGAEIEGALEAGQSAAAALPAVGLAPVDHAISVFAGAANALAQFPPPLAPTLA